MTVLVLRTPDVERTKEFFSKLGLTFVQEKHGDGPLHYACEYNGEVFEIYPTEKNTARAKFLDGPD
jgi:lactoylglutathione lyase